MCQALENNKQKIDTVLSPSGNHSLVRNTDIKQTASKEKKKQKNIIHI